MISTETVSPRYATIEDWGLDDLVAGLIEGQYVAIGAVQAARPALAAAIGRAADRLAGGGRLIYVGAGTSGRIAMQDAAELPPTFSWPYERALSLIAGGDAAIQRAQEGAEDREDIAVVDLDAVGVSAADVVVGLAASGGTPYTAAALAHARALGALTVGIYNNAGGRIAEVAEIPVLLETGAEVVAGSTRMKAGTAQKVALNCFSTGVMIQLGFVYRGRMVEMRPTNVKLHERAARMVAELADVDIAEARRALEEANGSIKIATVMLTHKLDSAAATALIEKSGGNLRAAMA
jgi:N-acetylmuramic acid 6-phosphate etherase